MGGGSFPRKAGPPDTSTSLPPSGPGQGLLRVWRDSVFTYAFIFTFLFLTHAPLLRLPYFWDEAGYFIPAARDLLLTGSLIPHTTLSNAHPPLLMIWLAFWWKFSAFTPAVTRISMLMVASFALLGLWRLARRVANVQVAAATVLCTALYPVFFAQSSLAHLDMMAAAFTLWGLAMYVERRPVATVVFLGLAPLAKETALIAPAALFAWELLCLLLRTKTVSGEGLCMSQQKPWQAARFLLCFIPIALWLTYHHHQTGYFFGNPEYLRYNLGATMNPLRVVLALLLRLWQVLGYLDLFVLTIAAAYAMSRPPLPGAGGLPRRRIAINVQLVFAVVIVAYVVALSIAGGAVLARYMLPVVPLVILLCVSTLYRRVQGWPWWIVTTCAGFLFALLTPPPYRIAPEDTLLYRDYVRLHKQAADQLSSRFPNSRVLTAWPASDELTQPFLGYVKRPLAVVRIENLSPLQMAEAARAIDQYEVVFLFSSKWQPVHPIFQSFAFPEELRERFFDDHEDVSPQRAAAVLGGRIVRYINRNNEWVAIIAIEKIQNAAAHFPDAAKGDILSGRRHR
jgi:hypothetical protein